MKRDHRRIIQLVPIATFVTPAEKGCISDKGLKDTWKYIEIVKQQQSAIRLNLSLVNFVEKTLKVFLTLIIPLQNDIMQGSYTNLKWQPSYSE